MPDRAVVVTLELTSEAAEDMFLVMNRELANSTWYVGKADEEGWERHEFVEEHRSRYVPNFQSVVDQLLAQGFGDA